MDLTDLKEGDLIIVVKSTDSEISLVWQGSIHEQNPEEFLDPFLSDLVDIAIEKEKKVICSFAELEYMNSSSIPPLIQLIRKLSENKVPSLFTYDKSRKVQVASFKALEVIAKKLKVVELIGK